VTYTKIGVAGNGGSILEIIFDERNFQRHLRLDKDK